jgi:hypothetical protein
MLCLHSGGVRVENREALQSIPCPVGAGRWKPIPHGEIANAAVARAAACGLEVEKEAWGLKGDDNAKLYGVLNFKADARLGLPAGIIPSMGIRSSFDKSLAIGIAIGAKVFVCDNGALVGDFTIRKLHTIHFRLNDEMDRAFSKFTERVGAINNMVNRLSAVALTDKDADSIILQSFRAEVMPWRLAPEVVKEYYEPKHEDFKPRNAWSLYNAFTEVLKQRSPGDQLKTFRTLNKVLVQPHIAETAILN